jgi:CubicO group peptidase (beta-lactamase class C family)
MMNRQRKAIILISLLVASLVGAGGLLLSNQAASVFQRMDLDGDKRLQRYEVGPLVRKQFYEFDADSNGVWDSGESAAYLRHVLYRNFVKRFSRIALETYPPSGEVSIVDIEAAVEEIVRKLKLPGATFIVGKDGREVFRVSVGEIQSDTVVPVASASKWVSSVVLMRLVERGFLDLNAPLDQYLKNLPAQWQSVSLKHLLALTSGADKGHGLEHHPITPYEQQFAFLIDKPMWGEADKQFAYGGISMQIAGYLAEQVSGKRWSELYREFVSDQVNMASSYYGHPFWNVLDAEINSPNLAGGLYTTANDYFRFLSALTEPDASQRLLGSQTLDLMERDNTSHLEQAVRPPSVPDDWFYGLGLWCESPVESRCTHISSAGAFGAFPWIHRDSGTYGILVTLGAVSDVLPRAIELRDMAIRAVN